MKTSNASFLFAASTLALLSACGGGGGGGGADGGTSTPTATTTVAITGSNQQTVARATVAGGFSVARAQNQGSADGATAQSAKGSVPTSSGAADLAVRRALGLFLARHPRTTIASVRAATASSSTDNCTVSGTLGSTLDDHDNSGALSAGDIVTIHFAQCQDVGSIVMDGTLTLTVSSVSGTQFSGAAAFQSLKVTQGSVATTLQGAATVTENDTDTQDVVTLDIGASGLAIVAVSATYNDNIAYEAGMRIVTTLTTATEDETITIDGAFSSTSLGGRVTLATPAPIVQLGADAFPSAGQVRITGASGSVLLLTALSSSQAQLQLDANGDGTYESTTPEAWTTLLPQ